MESSTPTVEDKIREMFKQVAEKHKPLVLEALRQRQQNADKAEYLKGWLRV